jgi:hypothetical protein
VVGHLDTGSEVCIIQYSVYKKISKKFGKMKNSNIKKLSSFCGGIINVMGEVQWEIKYSQYGKGIVHPVYIVKDIVGTPSVLFGDDLLKRSLGSITYTGTPENPIPTVTFTHPHEIILQTFYEKTDQLKCCYSTVDLLPYETKNVTFKLKSAATVLRNDFILISSSCIDTVMIIPSRTELDFDYKLCAYTGTARVVNTTNAAININVCAKFDIISSFSTIAIAENSVNEIKTALITHPVGREILLNSNDSEPRVFVPSINLLNASPGENMHVGNIDTTDTLYEKDLNFSGEAEVSSESFDAKGIEVPTQIFSTPEEAISLSNFPMEIQKYIKEIFLVKHRGVVSLHSLDAGDISKTLGFTILQLRQGEKLPRSKRLFHISPSDTRHLEDICNSLIQFGYISRSQCVPNGTHLYGMASYLVQRSKPGSLGRLIVDFSPINSILESPANVIPELTATLQFLEGKGMFSSLDMRYAFLSLKVSPESRKLTTFLTPFGSFEWISLPTGMASSPVHFSNALNKILHFAPVKDDKGNVVYEAENVVKLEKSILPDSINYFDDILCCTKMQNTYEQTCKLHFLALEKAVERLAFHGAKINVNKCTFGHTKICFLGWYISHNFLIADPRRIEKVKNFIFPTCKKSMRAFLGLCNSMRRVITCDVIKQMATLTPLTSSKTPFEPNDTHVAAFQSIKNMLVQEPLFSHLIDERAEKFLFVDAATKSGVLGGVLAQKRKGVEGDITVPIELNLENRVHQIIYDKKLPYMPAQLYTKLPIELPKPSLRKTVPPCVVDEKILLGYDTKNVVDSLFYSTCSILAIYGCKSPASVIELRKMVLKKIKSSILNAKLKDFVFNLNYSKYREYCNDFEKGIAPPDTHFYCVEALSEIFYRPVIVISSLEKHKNDPIFKFNVDSNKPPLVFGLFKRQGHEIFMPFYQNKNTAFAIDSLKDKIEIIAYLGKTLPEEFKNRPILDLEVFALLDCLHSVQKFVSGVPLRIFTDSRVLYYLFSSKVHNSSVKIRRWCLKLISDYPQVTLSFVKSEDNLADFLNPRGFVRRRFA